MKNRIKRWITCLLVTLGIFYCTINASATDIWDIGVVYEFYGTIDSGEVGSSNYTTFPTWDPDYPPGDTYFPLDGMTIQGQLKIYRNNGEYPTTSEYFMSYSDIRVNDDDWMSYVGYDVGVFSNEIGFDITNPFGFYANAGDTPGQLNIQAAVNYTGISNYLGISTDGYYFSTSNISYELATPIPEPATIFLLGSGLFGLAGLRKKFL